MFTDNLDFDDVLGDLYWTPKRSFTKAYDNVSNAKNAIRVINKWLDDTKRFRPQDKTLINNSTFHISILSTSGNRLGAKRGEIGPPNDPNAPYQVNIEQLIKPRTQLAESAITGRWMFSVPAENAVNIPDKYKGIGGANLSYSNLMALLASMQQAATTVTKVTPEEAARLPLSTILQMPKEELKKLPTPTLEKIKERVDVVKEATSKPATLRFDVKFPESVAKRLYDINVMLKKAHIQREATSEHNAIKQEVNFRTKVLRMLKEVEACKPKTRARLVRVILERI